MKKTLAEFYDMLNKHDWYYPFSDNITVYTVGRRYEQFLADMASTDPEYTRLYVAFEDHYFSGPAFGAAKIDKPIKPRE